MQIVAAALALALALPKFDLGFLGFLFLVPLLALAEKRGPWATAAAFFLSAFLSTLLILYWIPRVMVRYGGTTALLGAVGLAALAAFLSLWAALAGVLIRRALASGLAGLWLIPTVWVAKDLIVENILGGFPWCLAGYSLHRDLWLVQLAELGGVHLLTWLVVFVNALIFLAWRRRHQRLMLALALVLTLAAAHASGYLLLQRDERLRQGAETERAGIVQPNANHDQVMDSAGSRARLERLLADSRDLVRRGARLVIWPEFTVPIYPESDPAARRRLTSFASTEAPLIAGFTDLRSDGVFNSLFLYDGDQTLVYDKVHLTPFGEYIPLRRWLFFVRRITDEISDFSPGKELRPLRWRSHSLATPICYETIFPELVRGLVASGGEVIINISNDSWYGLSSAPYQSLVMAALRAVENRRWLLRSTSNGISALIDPAGRVLERMELQREGRLVVSFQYLRRRTLFNRCGHLFPLLCLGLTALFFLAQGLPKGLRRVGRRHSSQRPIS